MLKRTLYIANPYHLHLKNQQMVFSPQEGKDRSVPIEDIGFLVLEHPQISITMPLVAALNANNVAVVFCNEKYMPTSMLLNLDGNNLQSEFFRHQIDASVPLKKNLWKQTVEAKINNQAALLKKLGIKNNDLLTLAKDVKSDDSSNREGHAARLYWPRLFGESFIRERFGYHPNPMLNYAYIVLRSAVARSLVGSGLLATLGIHHHNKYNAFCLADDIMEPYRPYVDEMAVGLDKKYGHIDELEKEHKIDLLQILTCDVKVGDNKRPLMIALSHTTASLARCYTGEGKKIVYPKFE